MKKYYPPEGKNIQSRRSIQRSSHCIGDKARSLGLKYEDNKWTEEEDNILIKNYASLGVDKCANLLNRDRNAIKSRAGILNLKVSTKTRYHQRPFKILETGETFKSTKDLKEKYPEISIGKVRMCLHGKRRTCAGYHWVFIDEEN